MQDYLDPKLIQRLLRPIEQPGVINTGMGWEIVRRSQKFTNRLPLISDLTQRWNRKIGFQGEQIPIVYAQPQPQITADPGTISAELSQSSTPQRTVVQAKFAPDVSHLSTLTPKPLPTQGEESQTTNSVGWVEATKPNSTSIQGEGSQTTNSVAWVEATKPNSTSIQGKSSQTTNLVTKPNNMRMLGNARAQPNLQINPTLGTSSSNQRTIVQAKFATASDRSILPPNPTPPIAPIPIQTPPRQPSLNPYVANSSWETQAIFSDFRSQDLLAENSPNPQSQIPNSIGWSGLKIPLVFSSAGVNTESAKTELAVPNPGITGISRTEGLTKTAGLSKEVSSPMQSDETFNIQPDRSDRSNTQNPLDLEAITDKIERKIMQRLIVESERRGRNIWS